MNNIKTFENYRLDEQHERDLFHTKEAALNRAQQMGCEGYHTHEVDGNIVYAPCKNEEEYRSVIGKSPLIFMSYPNPTSVGDRHKQTPEDTMPTNGNEPPSAPLPTDESNNGSEAQIVEFQDYRKKLPRRLRIAKKTTKIIGSLEDQIEDSGDKDLIDEWEKESELHLGDEKYWDDIDDIERDAAIKDAMRLLKKYHIRIR